MQQQCKTHHILSGLSEAYPVDSGQGSVRPCVLCPFLGFGVFVSVGVWSVLVVGSGGRPRGQWCWVWVSCGLGQRLEHVGPFAFLVF